MSKLTIYILCITDESIESTGPDSDEPDSDEPCDNENCNNQDNLIGELTESMKKILVSKIKCYHNHY